MSERILPSWRIEAYHGFGTPNRISLRGRVRSDPLIPRGTLEDRRLRNFRRMLQRLRARGAAGVRVRIHLAANTWEISTELEGFFRLETTLNVPLADGIWHTVTYQLLDHPLITSTGLVMVPSSEAEFGIISDIDDTVVPTYATHTWRMIRTLLLKNAHTRLPFEGVSELYTALQLGADGKGLNPLFYVSSSPWNLHDLLQDFFQIQRVPVGPLFLRKWPFSPRQILRMEHQTHKLEQIRKLFQYFPELPWVLLGDSGQEDPEIYRTLVTSYADRIKVIYIRDVSGPVRDLRVQELAREAGESGVPMLLLENGLEALSDARARGLIPATFGITEIT